MTFRSIDCEIWQDVWFEQLSPYAKLLFIYLWSNSSCTQSGAYKISIKRMSFDVGFNVNSEILSELSDKVKWYPEDNIIWVKNFFKRQCQNDSFRSAAKKTLSGLPDKIKSEILAYWDNSEHKIDTVATPCPHPVDTVATPCPQTPVIRTEQIRTDKKREDGGGINLDIPRASEEKSSGKKPTTTDSIFKNKTKKDAHEKYMDIPIKSGNYTITKAKKQELEADHPKVDIDSALLSIRTYYEGDKKRLRKASEIGKSIVDWLIQSAVEGKYPRGDPPLNSDQRAEKTIRSMIDELGVDEAIPRLKILPGISEEMIGNVMKELGN